MFYPVLILSSLNQKYLSQQVVSLSIKKGALDPAYEQPKQKIRLYEMDRSNQIKVTLLLPIYFRGSSSVSRLVENKS